MFLFLLIISILAQLGCTFMQSIAMCMSLLCQPMYPFQLLC
uniref:Uncharacterized protein n=1 Tax=Arundo donax TaxID=35708 RepID=A0A0A9A4S9_ARUDO